MSDIKIKPVDGRAIEHPVTGKRITREMSVPNTREIRRALTVGDLSAVTDAPETAKKPAPKSVAKKQEAEDNGS